MNDDKMAKVIMQDEVIDDNDDYKVMME